MASIRLSGYGNLIIMQREVFEQNENGYDTTKGTLTKKDPISD